MSVGVGPGKHQLAARPRHAWIAARASGVEAAHGDGRAALTGGLDPPHLELRAAFGELDPGGRPPNRRRAVHVDTAKRRDVVEPNRRTERRAGVRRKRHKRVAVFTFRGEPGDGHRLAFRAQRRAIHRTRGNLPRVVVHRHRRRPLAAHQSRDVDVANLPALRSRYATIGPSEVTAAAVGQHSQTRRSIGHFRHLLAAAIVNGAAHAHVAARFAVPHRVRAFIARPSSHTKPSPAPGI